METGWFVKHQKQSASQEKQYASSSKYRSMNIQKTEAAILFLFRETGARVRKRKEQKQEKVAKSQKWQLIVPLHAKHSVKISFYCSFRQWHETVPLVQFISTLLSVKCTSVAEGRIMAGRA